MIGLYRMSQAKPEKRWTSMCMQIADFDCGDCPAPSWCACTCHRMQDLADALRRRPPT